MGKHFKSFSYNFEIYSAKDIVNFLLSEKLKVTFYPLDWNDSNSNVSETYIDWSAPVRGYGFYVEHWPMVVRLPFIDDILESNFHRAYSLSASVLWKSHERMYYPISGKRDEELVRQHDKVFSKVKRRFAMQEGELPKAIKDLEWLQNLKKIKHPLEIKTVEELQKLGNA